MNFILSLACVQGILLVIVLLRKHFSDKRTVNTLAILLVLTVLVLFGRVTWQPEFMIKYWAFISLPDVLLFLFGPLTYFLTHFVLKKDISGPKWPHFIPAAVHVLILNTILGLIIIEQMPLMDRTHLYLLYKIIEGAGIVSCGMYLILSYRVYVSNYGIYNNYYSSASSPTFLKHVLVAELVMIAIWTLSYFSKLVGVYTFLDYRIYDLFWMCISASIYLLAYQLLMNGELFNLPLPRKAEKQSDAGKAPGDRSKEAEKLVQLIETDKPYLEPDLNLTDLADLANMSRNELSGIINAELGVNFFDLINSYRVEEFVNTYEGAKQKVTYLEVAYQVGFNSKSVFYRAFKKQKGVSPSAFFKGVS